MFDFIRNHNRVLFFVMVLLIFPSFAFFGVQGYSRFSDPSSAAVARVDGQKVTRAEWDAQHKKQIAQLRERAPNVDVKLFDTPEARRQTLDNLMRERVLFAAANRAHLQVASSAPRAAAPPGGALSAMPPSTWRSIRSWRTPASKLSVVRPPDSTIAL